MAGCQPVEALPGLRANELVPLDRGRPRLHLPEGRHAPDLGAGREKQDKNGAPYFVYRERAETVPPAHSQTEGGHKPATAEERDKVYRAFMKQLFCTLDVKEFFDARGVCDESTLRKRYKSLPLSGRSKICRALLKAGLEPLMVRTPGFYVKKADGAGDAGYWTFAGRGDCDPGTRSRGSNHVNSAAPD